MEITKKDMWKLKEIANKLWEEERSPSVMLIHLKAMEIYLKQKGLTPQFTIRGVKREDEV